MDEKRETTAVVVAVRVQAATNEVSWWEIGALFVAHFVRLYRV